MTKTTVIGDVHGLRDWKKFTRWNFFGKIVFMGDYCDPYSTINPEIILDNLREIIELKRKHPERVILLLGNHDMHYLTQLIPMSSRYNMVLAPELHDLFCKNRELFQYAFQEGNVLYTHAGVSQGWWDECFHGDIDKNIAEQLNNTTDMELPILGQCGKARGGRNAWGGIFWADASELENPLYGFHQIVGHTRVKDIQTLTIDEITSVTFCDCLHNGKVLKVK